MDMEKREKPTPKASSAQWGPIVGLGSAVVALGIIGFAVARGRSTPEPEPVVTVAPEPKPVYVDIRSLAAAEPKRDIEEAAPASQPTTDEVPSDVAKGTGVIAVKKGGKAKVAKVAAVADKPYDPDYAARTARTPTYDPPSGYRGGGGAPRVYGEETPEERYWRLRREEESRNRPQSGVTPREMQSGTRDRVPGGLR